MTEKSPYFGFYEMTKKFADENKIQDFNLTVSIEFDATGMETVSYFYFFILLTGNRKARFANRDFNKAMEEIESYIKAA